MEEKKDPLTERKKPLGPEVSGESGGGKRKKSIPKDAFEWTSLGLNQGPPDYESVALTN